MTDLPANGNAFGAPGIEPRWTSSAKEGVGTAYHTSCRLWFTISHGIVKEHQGEMVVETEPGRFTRMHVELPVDKGEEV